jgi:hypothetical protein
MCASKIGRIVGVGEGVGDGDGVGLGETVETTLFAVGGGEDEVGARPQASRRTAARERNLTATNVVTKTRSKWNAT